MGHAVRQVHGDGAETHRLHATLPNNVLYFCHSPFLYVCHMNTPCQNLNQNPRTLLPKFFGLYCVQCGGKNIRVVVMNNILPRSVRMHLKFDLKGSTYKRRASKKEREKSKPTFKDLDFLTDVPEGLTLDQDTYSALVRTLQRDCLVRKKKRGEEMDEHYFVKVD